ncbi:MAG: GxGYxYP family putative glycoside hydrolase, partial [Bacillota bacterium]|nr:GxGYxYP family putative glycoside hydrolase [Bacillota bacterium]
MYKCFRGKLSILFLLLILLFSLYISPAINTYSYTGNVRLVLDASNYRELPKNFRKTSDLSAVQNIKGLNLSGLDKLNISGSHQFSGFNLPLLVGAIDTSLPITVVDLRQESHGFVNGIPVSWASAGNDANKGLTMEQVLSDEKSKLGSIKLNVPLTIEDHPNITVVPVRVEDEKQLVTFKALPYIRIPVTDGKLPEDDMVDYFVQFAKSQPQNSWLHFHCKEGVGRTTIFMIMYDMLKNSQKASADEIIKRQLLLAKFNESQVKSFYNAERTGFLQKFYRYSKEQGAVGNIKWSDWKKTQNANSPCCISMPDAVKGESNYIKNPIPPACLYVISQDKMTDAEKTMTATLQGVANCRSPFQIYTLSSSEPDYKIWLEDLERNYKIECRYSKDPWQLLDIFKKYVDGYVLFSNKNGKDPSINNACSFAALNNCIAVDEAIEEKVQANGITKRKADCRNTDEKWAFSNLWNSGLNHSLVVQLSPDKSAPLRDYAIMSKSLVFYEDSITDTALRDTVFSSMEKDSTCLGWGPDEFVNVSTASKYGVSMVAADWSYNLTVLSAFPSLPVSQKKLPTSPNRNNVHYVTFIMSDGDNMQWNLGTNFGSSKWYGSRFRGSFNMGWSLSPSLYYLAPTVFNQYYKSAARGSGNDYFLVPPSGDGYMYPSKFDRSALNKYIDRLDCYMKNTDQKYAAIIDDSSFHDKELWDKFTAKSGIQGLFYLDYHRHDNYHGEIIWSNDKPIVSCRDLLWNKLENEAELVKNINTRVNSGQTDIHKPDSYTFVYVHAWSK